jgi:hypothetical protein
MTHPSFPRLSIPGRPILGRPILDRRGLIGGSLALAASTTLPARAATPIAGVPPAGRLLFHVFRNDSQIGTHQLTFHTAGSALTVNIDVEFKVGLGPLTLFRYSMRTTEHWQDGNLVSATSKANNDGKPESMTAKLQGDALAVQGSKSGHYTAPPGTILATHWNRAELKGPMINPENGELMTFTIADKGTGPIQAAGQTIQAAQYALTGPAKINLWYSDQSIWSALKAAATDNSMIDYRLA